jgi:single-strand DNA-binding protein
VNEIPVTICGNAASEVRHVCTDQGLAIASFRIAATERRYERGRGWVDGETNYLTVTCFRALADNVAASLQKGQPVIVTGRLRIRSWKKDERHGLSAEVEAAAVGHDLSRGTSAFRRIVRTTPVAPGRPEADELVEDLEAAEAGYADTGGVEPGETRGEPGGGDQGGSDRGGVESGQPGRPGPAGRSGPDVLADPAVTAA